MRTERDVRENPVAGDRVKFLDVFDVQAVVGNLVGCTVENEPEVYWFKREAWVKCLDEEESAILHIAQPGGEA